MAGGGQHTGASAIGGTGARASLRGVSFEVACANGITLRYGSWVVTGIIFALPVLGILIVIGIRRGVFKPRDVQRNIGKGRYDEL